MTACCTTLLNVLCVGLECRVPEECPQGVVDLFRACIAQDPGARPSAAEVQAALEALLPIPRPGQAEQSVSGELAATSNAGGLAPQPCTPSSSSSGGSAPQPCTPPQTQRHKLDAPGAVREPPSIQQSFPGAAEEGMAGVQSSVGAAGAVQGPTSTQRGA